VRLEIIVMGFTLAGLCGVSVEPVCAATEEPPAAVSASPGDALAILLTDDAREISKIDPLLDSLYEQLSQGDPDIAILEVNYPGIDKAWKDAMRPIMLDEMRLHMPGYRQELSEFFAANFTDKELDVLAAFYESATGQKLIDNVTGALSFKNVAAEIATEIDDNENDVSSAALQKDVNFAATRALQGMTPEQKEEVGQFGLSAVGQKFAKFIPQKQAIDYKWFNVEPSDESLERIDREIAAALDAFIASVDEKAEK
jgi:Uncharacterized protein conserved in bacteria (DUF2059)